jgi:hypothetical protein
MKNAFTFPTQGQKLPVFLLAGSALIAVIICMIANQTPVYMSIVGAMFWAWISQMIGSKFNEYMGSDYRHKVPSFLSEYFFQSVFYGVGFIAAIITLFDMRQANSLFIGWTIGILFPILLATVWFIKEGYAALQEIDSQQR